MGIPAMNLELLDLVGAIGFQIDDTWTTYLGINTGAMEGNKIFRFLNSGKVEYFIVVGIIKVLLAVFLYAWALLNPAYAVFLEFDFYFEAGVTMWNIFMIYDHKVRR
jgi:hypothetical protein